MLLLFYLLEFGGSLCFLIWKSLCGSHGVCPECLNEVVGVLTPPVAGLGSRDDLLAVCRLGCCSAPFLKITFSVPHPWPPWLHARPRAEPLVFILFQLEVSLPRSLCCLGLGPCVDLGWYWVDIGLTVFPYWLGSRTPAAFVRALPDFWWHCSRRFLGCFFFFFSEVHLPESRILSQQWEVVKLRPVIRGLGQHEGYISGWMRERSWWLAI